jgi:hypothetical protein
MRAIQKIQLLKLLMRHPVPDILNRKDMLCVDEFASLQGVPANSISKTLF